MPIYHGATSGEVNPGDGRIGGEDWDAVHEGSSDWSYTHTKANDQGVTNSNTLVNESALTLSVKTNETWRIEYDIIYTTDATGDIKFDVALSAGTMSGYYRLLGSDTTANALLSTSARLAAVADTPDITAGGGALTIHRVIDLELFIQVTADATLNLRFAQNTTTAGQTATVKAGTRIRARRMSSDLTIAPSLISNTAATFAPTVS